MVAPFLFGVVNENGHLSKRKSALHVWRFADGTQQAVAQKERVQHYYGVSRCFVEGIPMNFPEDIEITLQKALEGDALAWDALFTRLWPVLTAITASRLISIGGEAAVEDAAQNALFRLTADNARRLRYFDASRGSLESYIAKVAYNSAIDYCRSHSKHFHHANLDSLPEPIDENENALPMVEEWEILAAKETLSPREREVINLIYRENLGTSEVAERLGVGMDTMRSEKSHALKKLKKFFGVS